MLQTLFYIPNEFGGLNVFGFGIVLAVWAVAGGGFLAWLVRRQGFNADTKSYLPVLGVIGVAIAFVLPAICEPQGLPIRGYGMMILLAVVAAMGLAAWRAKRVGVNTELLFPLAFWMIVPGILGARAIYVREYWHDEYLPIYLKGGSKALLFAIVNIPGGGLVVYGAFFGGMLGMWLFCRRYRVPLLAMADLIAPSMLIGLALGRVGCLLNGCCFGGPCELPWKVTFPWTSEVHRREVHDGMAPFDGLKFRDGSGGKVLVEAVDADSPAARAGLAAGDEIAEVNGVPARGYERNGHVVTGAERVRATIQEIDKLDLTIARPDGDTFEWMVDDPPAAGPDTDNRLKIHGLRVTGRAGGGCVIVRVRFQSPEASAGLEPGQRIVSVSGRPVGSLGQLASLLDEHRRQAWLRLEVAGRAALVDFSIERPLPRSLALHPTQLYSTIDALILCLLLLAYDRFRRRDGALTAIMMTVYAVTRFLIEQIRTDEAPIKGTGLHISQLISIGILAAAICLWVYILRRPARLDFGGPAVGPCAAA